MLAEGGGDLGGVAGGADDAVAGVEGGPGQLDAHAAGGAGDEPDGRGGGVVSVMSECLPGVMCSSQGERQRSVGSP